MPNTSTRIAILGGGVAGCVLARRIGSMRGVTLDLLERDQRLGGLQRSVDVGGTPFDIGAFIFVTGHPLFSVFPGLGDLFVEVEHLTVAVTPTGRVAQQGSPVADFIRTHGLAHAARAALDLIASKARHRRRDTFASWIRYYLGETIYRESGLKEYVERFFLLPESEIDLEFARQRLASMADGASLRRKLARGLSRALSTQPREPWRCRVRPPGGFDVAYEHIAGDLRMLGVGLRLGTQVQSIARCGSDLIVTANDRTEVYDRVISTMPLAATASYLGPHGGRDSGLEQLTLVSLFYRFRGAIDAPGHFFYNMTARSSWKRFVVLSRYYGTIDDEHYLVVECTRRTVESGSITEAARDFEAHVATLSFMRGALRLVGAEITPNAYPLLRRGYAAGVAALRGRIEEAGIELAGRQGTFRIMSSQDVAEHAHEVAGRVVTGAGTVEGG